ncbi:MAG: PemK-like, MazF-like toxin of type toxin-antitoxin system [Candidatus Binatota bacterium]|nr:PemK-like, MazF-like toxin of type toxin-antitoxin system [Candidatus Binatota bacterium]
MLRVELPAGVAGNRRDCDVMIDQCRAVDRARLRRPLGALPPPVMAEIGEKVRLVGDL